MYSHPIKKLFALIIFYAIIIVGILVLQFRSESVFSDNLGILRLTMAKTESTHQSVIKNSLQATFNGLLLYFNDNDPVCIKTVDSNNEKNITLISWNKASPLSCTFTFTDDVVISISVSDEEKDASMVLHAEFPSNIEYVSLNYKTSRGYSVTDLNKATAQIETKNQKFLLNASAITDNKIVFLQSHPLVAYSVINEDEGFSIDKVASLAIATQDLYTQNIRKLEVDILTYFNDAIQNNIALTEQSVIAYVSIMAKNGQYNKAIDTVPDSFKRGQKRTYLSAPYFNTLQQMYSTLNMQISNMEKLMQQAVDSNSCSIFSVYALYNYILQSNSPTLITNLLRIPLTADFSTVTPSQALGIIHLYTKISPLYPALTRPIETVLDICLDIAISSCSFTEDNEKVIISENGTALELTHSIEAAQILLEYGTISNNQKVVSTALALINSSFTNPILSNLDTYSRIYPILVPNNSYYPHFEQIYKNGNQNVWAWTCANGIQYETQENQDVTLNIVFPQGLTHYLMVGGIETFERIQIYGMNFRTDPRFETYNSSGYVYLNNQKVLLLKSRHRTETETIRLFANEEEIQEEIQEENL